MTDVLVREVEEVDRSNLLSVSYSKLDLYTNCNYRYKLKYLENNFDSSNTIPLTLGSICHKVLELKGNAIMNKECVDYDYLTLILHKGFTDEHEESILGIDRISTYFFEDWNVPDNKSGMTYEEKIKVFEENIVRNELEDDAWTLIGCEIAFEFVYDNRVIIHGYIDRVEINEYCQLRVTDYKTSKASYDEKKLATPLQMFIYGLACYHLYGEFPTEYMYRFVLIDETQRACTKGYIERGIRKLNKVLDSIDKNMKSGIYPPNPSPLCYWCPFCKNNPDADSKLKNMCDYYGLWTPDNKVFSVNKQYNALTESKSERKLIF